MDRSRNELHEFMDNDFYPLKELLHQNIHELSDVKKDLEHHKDDSRRRITDVETRLTKIEPKVDEIHGGVSWLIRFSKAAGWILATAVACKAMGWW